MNLKDLLVELRSYYFKDSKKATRNIFIVLGVALLVGIAMDIFLPFEAVYNWLRFIPAIGIAFGLFCVYYIYLVVIYQGRKQMTDPEYLVPKLRYPPRVRWVYGAIIVAVVFALELSIRGGSPVYTFISGLTLATVVAVVEFCLYTEDELFAREQGIPDARDRALNNRLEAAKERSEKKMKAREKEKQKKRADRPELGLNPFESRDPSVSEKTTEETATKND